VAVKQPRLALGSATIDNNLFNSSEFSNNIRRHVLTVDDLSRGKEKMKTEARATDARPITWAINHVDMMIEYVPIVR
jgi:hypothetical protein